MNISAKVPRAAALLLAGAASGPLFAQSTVNISGTIDIGAATSPSQAARTWAAAWPPPSG
jgi:hypothetical protein